MADEYTALVLAAQADTDPAHRQLAMDQLARIVPHVSHDTTVHDDMAAPVLAHLYPQAQPSPEPDIWG